MVLKTVHWSKHDSWVCCWVMMLAALDVRMTLCTTHHDTMTP